jgi:hypothetical protein
MTVLAVCAVAQDPAAPGSISGVVVDVSSGLPIGNVPITITPRRAPDPRIVTDEHGRFKVANLAPRGYIFQAEVGWHNPAKMITLRPGQNLESMVIAVRSSSTISGRVLDENKKPLPDMWVAVVRRDLFAGVPRYAVVQTVVTNSEGEYRFEGPAGRTYYLAALKRPSAFAPAAEVPADPALRRPTFVVTWFPNSPSPDIAEPLSVQPQDRREHVDFVMLSGPSFCLETVLETNGRPSPLKFSLLSMTAWSNALNTDKVDRTGIAGNHGKVRICDVSPGEYRIEAWDIKKDTRPFFSSAIVTVDKKDVQDVKLAVGDRVPLKGEVTVEGPPEIGPVVGSLGVELTPAPRGRISENASARRIAIPGLFSLGNVAADEYKVTVYGIPPRYHLKDVAYGGVSVLAEPLRVGAGTISGLLRVILGNNAAEIHAQVKDGDGNPASDCMVYAIPAKATSEAELSSRVNGSVVGRDGSWRSGSVEPGKYLVIATSLQVDATPETIRRLMRARPLMTEVELPPGGKIELTLKLAQP